MRSHLNPASIHLLVDDYNLVLSALPSENGRKMPVEVLSAALQDSGDWTESGASEVVRLANEYGVFMLRNALALAIAMGKEDGDRGF